MPTYQYRCTECGTDLEVVQKFSDPSLTVCPECEGSLRKVFNAVGVVFKGSGFYRTDSRSADSKSGGGARKSESADSSSKSTSDAGAPSSSESKSDSGSKNGSSEKKTPATSGSSTGSKAANT